MAYSALFSVFPALLILVTIVQRWGSTALIDDLRQVAEKHLPTEMVAVLDLYLRQLLHERFPAALTFGTLTLLWLASRFLNAVLKGLSITYPEQRTRRALTRRLCRTKTSVCGETLGLPWCDWASVRPAPSMLSARRSITRTGTCERIQRARCTASARRRPGTC